MDEGGKNITSNHFQVKMIIYYNESQKKPPAYFKQQGAED